MRLHSVNIFRYVLLLGLPFFCSFDVAKSVDGDARPTSVSILNPSLTDYNNEPGFAVDFGKKRKLKSDSLPKTNDFVVVIPFEYKQSSLNFSSTFKLMDSVSSILLQNDSVTLSIDGYSYFDEGMDHICYALSLNRALCVKLYVQGRGIDSSRIVKTEAKSYYRSVKRKIKKEPVSFNCTAEIILHFPIPPEAVDVPDIDGDGIVDIEDSCPEEYGEIARNGCPNKNAIIIPFEPQQSSLASQTYKVMDSVIAILRTDPAASITIEGHAYKKEGVMSVCESLAKERAAIVRKYLLTRRIDDSRIKSVESFSTSKPLNAGRNSWEIARNSRAEIILLRD